MAAAAASSSSRGRPAEHDRDPMERAASNVTVSHATEAIAAALDSMLSNSTAWDPAMLLSNSSTALDATAVMMANATAAPNGHQAIKRLQPFIILIHVLGILGNLLALFILYRTRSSSNQKHGFMLRCLAFNDVIALTGMSLFMFVSIVWRATKHSVWRCRALVLLRFFGLGSGCVAIVMAIERWLALTKPFYYQKVRATNRN